MTLLEGRGFGVIPLMTYRHLPDREGVRCLEGTVPRGEEKAMAFVAALQVEFLFEEAEGPAALKEAFAARVKALAVGRVTADALRE